MGLLKRKSADLQELRDITEDVDEAVFVPYACHVDPHTVLTKNGELLQTIKIVGFTFEDIARESMDLRTTIRTALKDALKSNDYALWIHTIRRKASLMPPGRYPNDFSQVLNAAWRQHHDWEHKYVNELYITIVKEGQTSSIKEPHYFAQSLVPALERRRRWKYLDAAHEQLAATVDQVMAVLQNFGARKLGFYEKDGVICSEVAGFLSKLTRLRDDPVPLTEVSLADTLTTHEVTFGFNAMEMRNENGRRRFGALLTIKEYREMTSAAVDVLLQLDAEFIVTQCMDFINQKKALQDYREQQEIYRLSEETELPEKIGLNEILESDHHSSVDFGEQQINIFVLGDTVKILEQNVGKVVRGLNNLGIIAVREDIKFEEVYWSLLPANFEFLRRLKPINTDRIGGFASINNLPAGLASGSKWGPPVTVFFTAAHTPYFFNFHVEDNGHTAIIGPYGAGKTVLLNFMLSEARKFNYRLFFFDRGRGAEIFLRGIGAEYLWIDRRPPVENKDIEYPEIYKAPKLNPLQMEDTPQNRSFLLVWLDALLRADKLYRPEMSEEFWPIFQEALDYTLKLPREQRYLIPLIDYLREHHPKVAAKMYGWYSGGEFEDWFSYPEDELDISGGMIGFELSSLMQQSRVSPAISAYLLHRVMLMLDQTPTIIVLDEAWDLLDNPVFASRMGGWLEMLRSRNTLVIMATEKPDEVLQSPLSPTIMEHLATQIFLPNRGIDPRDYQKIFDLTPRECEFIQMMERAERHFLLKRGRVSIVAELNLEGLETQVAVLSAKPAALKLMERMVARYDNPEPMQWLPDFMTAVESGELDKQ